MSVATVIIGLLGGGVIGTALTGFFSATHQRAERFRERLLVAAGEMLAASDEALHAFVLFRRRDSEQFRAMKVLSQAQVALEQVPDALKALVADAGTSEGTSEDLTEQLIAAERAINAIPDIRGRMKGPHDQPIDEEELSALAGEIRGVRRMLAEGISVIPPPLATALEQMLDAGEALVPASSEQRGAYREWDEARNRLSSMFPKVILLFTIKNRNAAVVAANEVSSAFDKAARAMYEENTAGRDPGMPNEVVNAAIRNVSAAIDNFARAANAEVQRGWV